MEQQNVLERILEGNMGPTHLPLETLRKITDDFSEDRIIGEGGFGTVYKGVVRNKNVAVKRIRRSMTIDEKLFRREAESLMEVNHQNIVQFLGLCSQTVEIPFKNPESRGYIYVEIRERLLCFEYISNGSLDKKITDELRGLEWDKRYKIIKGICAGLHHLHMEKGILHLNLKPANILLDSEMVPKITDFGLSRLIENSQTMSTNYFSSLGYCAPENLFGCGRMSVKSDIYSLGVIIIELVTGHKGIPDTNVNILRRWRHRWNKSGKGTSLEYYEQVTKCIEIGSLCQTVDPCARPSISEIMSKFVEMESIDDMLGVEPLELQFDNSQSNKLSCSVELCNDTDSFIAFKIQTTSPLPYCIEPKKGIVKPRTKCSVYITLPAANAQDHYNKEFVVWSIKVREGLTTSDINEDMFHTHITGRHVDVVHLTVSSEEPCNKEVEEDNPATLAPEPSFLSKWLAIGKSSLVLEHIILDASAEPTNLPLALLQHITEDFADERKIGHGGFGVVYKGDLQNGSVAVKRLRNCHTIDEEPFFREATSLIGVKHQNIVRFLGYCANTEQQAVILPDSVGTLKNVFAEIRERLLCFEYISNGSLDRYLTDELTGLEWHTRYQIIRGICDGLVYLHEEKGIVHRDMKPANILLDNLMIPKVADFGISKLLEGATHAVTTNTTGSLGYCAPEFIKHGVVSIRSDIYSLGVIIIEIMTGCKDHPDIKHVLRRWRYRWSKSAKYPSLGYEQVTKCIEIALSCLSESPKERPYVWDIVSMLNELESTNESVGPISPYKWELLEFDKLELNFPFEINKKIPCSLVLTNITDGYVAFDIEMAGILQYCLEPDKGVVPPRSRCSVVVTLQPRERAPHAIICNDECVVRCTTVDEGLTAQEITKDMFDSRSGKVVDEVTLKVVF